MNIVVCIKQVPDTTEVMIDSKTNNLVREGVPSIVNPFDINALEAALSLRDEFGGKVTVVSMGPPQAKQALTYCLEMGADEAMLLSDRAVGGSDTLATGYALSKLIRPLKADVIFCGNEAIDGCTGQVGPIIAGNLDLPQFTYVTRFEIAGDVIKVCRDSGVKLDFYEAKLPVLLCVLKGINKPRKRVPTDKTPKIVSAADIGLDLARVGNDGSPTKVVSIKMSNVRAKSFVTIDDSLDWEERIQMIIDGGIKKNKKVDLWRGTEETLADRFLNVGAVKRLFEMQ
jgi:electron transfer flavoprotein beta subunit